MRNRRGCARGPSPKPSAPCGMQVVLDTNVLVSGVFWRGPASRILELWAKDKIEVVVSPEILTEYQRLLAEMELERSAGLADAWTVFIAQHATVLHPVSR